MTQSSTTGTTKELRNEEVIFSSVFSADEGVYRRKQDLVLTFNTPTVFKNEFHIFYILTKEFPKVIPTPKFIELYLRTNRANYQKNPNIELANYRIGDTEPYVEFVNSCLALFDECTKRTVTDEDYHLNLEMYKMEYINMESVSILEEAATVISEGVTIGNKTLSGYDDMRSTLKTKFIKLDNMVAKTDRKGTITYGVTDDEEEESGKLARVTTFGIKRLDDALGGVYEGDMVSLLAPAKGGKSRISTFVLHNAVVNHGTNIVMWSVENGYKGWEALIRARHFNWFYNKAQTDVTQKRIIDADMIRKGEFPSPELEQMELASWTDLKSNSNYGRITNIDSDFDFDTFEEVVDNAVNEFGAKLICVDYLQLITGGGKNVSKNERIGEAYKKMLQYLKKKKVGGIFPAQLKQTVVGDINKQDPEDLINMELRDSAGESYEVIKTPDVNLSLYGTIEDIRNGTMKILSIPSRNSQPFEPIDLHVDLGTCTFASVDKAV